MLKLLLLNEYERVKVRVVHHFDKAVYTFDGNAEKYWNTSMTLKQYMAKRAKIKDFKKREELDSFWEIMFSPDDILSVEQIAIN